MKVEIETNLSLPLGDGWGLHPPATDRLVIINATAKLVLDLLRAGVTREEIAGAFTEHFDLPLDDAASDVACDASASPSIEGDEIDCGEWRFGEQAVHIVSSVPELTRDYFARFAHEIAPPSAKAAQLRLSTAGDGYRLTLEGESRWIGDTLPELIARLNELFLGWEHPDVELLAYFHAAAVSRNARAVLLPGASGAGNSTLVGYLCGHGFSYLGDDLVALSAHDWSLRPLPTLLSLKSESWNILEGLFPERSDRPTLCRQGRDVRYVAPRARERSSCAPAIILFPSYTPEEPATLAKLTPLQTITRLLESAMDIEAPVTEAKIAEICRFILSTPAYELRYGDLAQASKMVEDALDAKV
ncbi:hypothetical protein A1351_15930 [Methylosinus sp. R-45379]|uniref:hypothetical protein n=1 Tax=unclassified Methylosinus TaxID=2624500 RepID=UPI0004665401|nr:MULTISPECIES: hypothetical protein [unclassified Methylosinus]OAI25846.1 hypothetical protein A1351_15930 [Methylosinus sp. R-45379]